MSCMDTHVSLFPQSMHFTELGHSLRGEHVLCLLLPRLGARCFQSAELLLGQERVRLAFAREGRFARDDKRLEATAVMIVHTDLGPWAEDRL